MLAWLKKRLTLFEYVGLHILVGLLMSLFCLWVFARLADEVFKDSWVLTLDDIIINQFHYGVTHAATFFFFVITQLGGLIIWGVGLGIIVFLVYREKNWQPRVAVWVIALLGGQLLNLALKAWFARPRPVFDNPIATAAFYSFPSGHAMMSIITYGLAAYFLIVNTQRRSRKLLILTITVLIVALVGLSRLYLGVHYLSDVGAGYAAGGVWLITCITALDFLKFRENRKRAQLENQQTEHPDH
jgi:membrane-associated phospholipid phosphatase